MHPHTPRSFRGPRGDQLAFTLIELLTVIAIIGILASILIPTVAKSRELAHRANCGSNVRQIALAILAYEGDYGVLPGPTEREIQSPLRGDDRPNARLPKEEWPNNNVDMSVILEDYLGTRYNEGETGPFHCQTNAEGTTLADNRRPVFLLMRNIKTNPASFFGDTDFSDARRFPKPLSKIRAAGFGLRSRQATELSQIWMISDIDGGNYGSASGIGGDAPLSSRPPHDGGRNYAFFDGHLEYCKPGPDGRWTYPASTGDAGNHGH